MHTPGLSRAEAIKAYEHVHAADLLPCHPDQLPLAASAAIASLHETAYANTTASSRYVETLTVTNSSITTYLAHQMKLHGDGLQEERVYAVDTTPEQGVIGYGFARMMQNPSSVMLEDIPFVGDTYTAPHARGDRLGMRRLFILNAASRLVLGGPLHSSAIILDGSAWRHWNALQQSHNAYKVQLGSQVRYCFTGYA